MSVSIVPNAAITLHYEYGTTSRGVHRADNPDDRCCGHPKVVGHQRPHAQHEVLLPDALQHRQLDHLGHAARTFFLDPAGGRAAPSPSISPPTRMSISAWGREQLADTLNHIASDDPDFLIDLGDTFAMDKGSTRVSTVGDTAAAEQKYKNALPFFNIVSGFVAHLPGAGQPRATGSLAPDGQQHRGNPAISLPVMGKNAEKKYFLNPFRIPSTAAIRARIPTSAATSETGLLRLDLGRCAFRGDQPLLDHDHQAVHHDRRAAVRPIRPARATAGTGRWDSTNSTGSRRPCRTGRQVQVRLLPSDRGRQQLDVQQVNYGHGGMDSANLVEWGGDNVGGGDGWATNRSGWGSQTIRQMMERTA